MCFSILNPGRITMNSSLILNFSNILMLLYSIASLCITSAIFDFIITNQMFYTLPEKIVLIDESVAVFYYVAASLALHISLCSLFFSQTSQKIIDFAIRNNFLVSVTHGLSLLSCCVLSAFCSIHALQTARNIAPYAFNATPIQFEKASHWYYTRLIAATVLFALQSVLSGGLLTILYMGLRCKYRSFAQLQQGKSGIYHSSS